VMQTEAVHLIGKDMTAPQGMLAIVGSTLAELAYHLNRVNSFDLAEQFVFVQLLLSPFYGKLIQLLIQR
jgi:hypothetical protein